MRGATKLPFENTSRLPTMSSKAKTGTSQYFFLAITKRTNCTMKDTSKDLFMLD